MMEIKKAVIKNPMLKRAVIMASDVEFLDDSELRRYVAALYDAMLWGQKINRENRKLKER